jgi:hypothetical protein
VPLDCGNEIDNGGLPGATGCTMLCNGNKGEFCGGPARLNVYQFGATPPAASNAAPSSIAPSPSASPAAVAQVGWNYKACYAEIPNGRTLPNGVQVAGLMTVEGCQSACQAAGYILAGLEYSQECWCGNTFSVGGAPATDGEVGCNMACKGNANEMCGGSLRLNVYEYGTPAIPASVVASAVASASPSAAASGWLNLGCYTDPGPRTLLNLITLAGATTVELCQAGCAAQGYTLAGVEYGGECWCDSQIRNQGVPATSGCTMTCNGNPQETCGGPNRLNMYQLGGTAPSAVIASASASATAAGSTGIPTGWSYGGCYVDNNPLGRIVANQLPDSQSLTAESCIASCVQAGYVVAAMEFSTQCFCGPVVRFGASTAPETDCGMPCAGNANEKCGGPNRMSVYGLGNITVQATPAAQTGGLPGSWKYVGCVK